jgi:hypothetical protein
MARFSSLKLRCEFESEVELGDALSATKRKGHKRNWEFKKSNHKEFCLAFFLLTLIDMRQGGFTSL